MEVGKGLQLIELKKYAIGFCCHVRAILFHNNTRYSR